MTDVRLIACVDDCSCHMTVARFVDIYVEDYAKLYKASWYDDHRRLKKHVVPRYGSRLLTDISRQDITNLHSTIGRTAKYEANRVIELLHRFFEVARDREFFPEDRPNPARKMKHFPEYSREETLNDDEMNRLIDAIFTLRYRTTQIYYLILIFTALRRDELLQMQWRDVDFDTMQFRVRRETVKNRKTHYLPITPFVKQLLDFLPKKTKFVFPAHYGKEGHLEYIDKSWTNAKRRANIEGKRLHDLRRTAASWLVNEDVTLPVIQKLLNHSTISATMVYARLQNKPVRRALNQYEGKLLATGKLRTMAGHWEKTSTAG